MQRQHINLQQATPQHYDHRFMSPHTFLIPERRIVLIHERPKYRTTTMHDHSRQLPLKRLWVCNTV